MTNVLIPQQYVGRMNVVGDCFVFGAALHDSQPVYLDIAGPATSVEAVWARLAQGKEARIVPDIGSSIVLQPPEPGLFARFQRKIDGLGIDHLLLVHKDITEFHLQGGEVFTWLAHELRRVRQDAILSAAEW